MKGRHHRTTGPQGGRSDDRDKWFVHVENVEVGPNFADQPRDIETEGQRHHRAIRPHRPNASDLDDAIPVVGDGYGPRSENCDLLPGCRQQPRDVANLLLHSPGPCQVVRTDQADPH